MASCGAGQSRRNRRPRDRRHWPSRRPPARATDCDLPPRVAREPIVDRERRGRTGEARACGARPRPALPEAGAPGGRWHRSPCRGVRRPTTDRVSALSATYPGRHARYPVRAPVATRLSSRTRSASSRASSVSGSTAFTTKNWAAVGARMMRATSFCSAASAAGALTSSRTSSWSAVAPTHANDRGRDQHRRDRRGSRRNDGSTRSSGSTCAKARLSECGGQARNQSTTVIQAKSNPAAENTPSVSTPKGGEPKAEIADGCGDQREDQRRQHVAHRRPGVAAITQCRQR